MSILNDEQLRVGEAPSEAPPFGEASYGFVDEIVWVRTDNYTGVAYCDETCPVTCEECAPCRSEDEDAECLSLTEELYVYTDDLLAPSYLTLTPEAVRLATKNEVRGWYALQRGLS